MVAWAAPAIELLICALTYEFPIRPGSEMLEELCRKKAAAISGKAHQSSQADQNQPPVREVYEQQKSAERDAKIIQDESGASDEGSSTTASVIPTASSAEPTPSMSIAEGQNVSKEESGTATSSVS